MIKQTLYVLCLTLSSSLRAMENYQGASGAQQIENQEELSRIVKEQSTLYLNSLDQKLIPLPQQFLSSDFIKRLQGASKHLLSKEQDKFVINCTSYTFNCLETACKIALHEGETKIAQSSLNKDHLSNQIHLYLLQFASKDRVSSAHSLLQALQFLSVSTECFSYVLQQCQHITTTEAQTPSNQESYQVYQEESIISLSESSGESLQKMLDKEVVHLVKEQSTLYLKSMNHKLIPLPQQFLSPDFIQRLQGTGKYLLSKEGDKLVINCTFYTFNCLETACKIALHEATVKITRSSLDKNQLFNQTLLYLLQVPNNKMISYTQSLLQALRFLSVSAECFSYVLHQCQYITNTEAQKLFYTCEEFYQALQEENIKSLPEAPEEIAQDEEGAYVRQVKSQLTLSPRARRQIAFSMALKYAQQDPTISYPYTIDQKSWQDLELFCGPKSSPTTCFANTIDHSSTELGKVLLYGKLLQATTDVQELTRKQNLIQYLLHEENKNVFHELDQCFKDFFKDPAYENTILSLFGPLDYFRNTTLKSQETLIPHLEKLSQWLNTHEIAVLVNDKHQVILTCCDKIKKTVKKIRIPLKGIDKKHIGLSTKVMDLGAFLLGFIISFKQGSGIELIQKAAVTATAFSGSSLVGKATSYAATTAISYLANSLASTIFAIFNYSVSCPEDLITGLLLERICMQQKLTWLAKYVTFLKKVDTLVEKLPLLKEFIPSLKTLNLQEEDPEHNAFSYMWHYFSRPADFETFINKIKLFDCQNSSMFKHFTARVLATYRLIDLHKEKFFNPVMAIAELDATLSLVRLYKQAQGKPNTFSFPQYIQAYKPCIELTNFWNPAVGHDAIANSLTLNLNGHPKDIIITGPNAGGKSTLMRALIYALLMGQSYGIIPAQQDNNAQTRFTPFANIRAYLNITDDPVKGKSLFQVSIQRAQELIQSAQQATPHALSLTLFDELYNGTKPEIAESLAFGTLKHLSTLPYNMCIASTHFPCVEKLQESTGTNFAYSQLASRSTAETRHKLQPGIYNEFNGFELAQEAQLPSAVIGDSQNYHHQKFREGKPSSLAFKLVENLLKSLKNASIETLIEVTTVLSENKGLCMLFHVLMLTPPYSNQLVQLIEKLYQTSPEVTKKLLNLPDSEGKTLLHHVVIKDMEDPKLILTLLDCNASIDIQDTQGKSPFQYARPETYM